MSSKVSSYSGINAPELLENLEEMEIHIYHYYIDQFPSLLRSRDTICHYAILSMTTLLFI